MRSKLVVAAAVLILILLLKFLSVNRANSTLADPKLSTLQPIPSSSPNPTPEDFNFNSTTDLKAQLDTVNPKIEDDNIAKLQDLIKSL